MSEELTLWSSEERRGRMMLEGKGSLKGLFDVFEGRFSVPSVVEEAEDWEEGKNLEREKENESPERSKNLAKEDV